MLDAPLTTGVDDLTATDKNPSTLKPMRIRICYTNAVALLSGVVVLACSVVRVQADYASAVLANSPLGYWRLNETSQPPAADVANNSGSLGAAATGYYVGAASHPVSGALKATTDAAASYDATAGTVTAAPYLAALNPDGAFTVEAWLNPGADTTAAAPTCPLSSGQFASPRSGWLIYQVDTGWAFRMYNENGTAFSVNLVGGPAPVVGTWSHVVAVYDGTTAYVYVNGVQAASDTPTGYVPSAGGSFYIGGRADASFWWNGQADEVAVYDTALSASVISSHYQNGISPSPATPYNQLVLASAPLAYYRLNETAWTPPTVLPVAKNLGSLGLAGDGSYNPGMQAGAPGPAFAGFGANNLAGAFNGLAGHVGTPTALNDLAQFTIMGWIKRGAVHSGRGGYFGQNDLLEFGDADSGANIEAWINAYNTNIKIPYPFRDNEWGYMVLVGDGAQVTLYTNGIAAYSIAGTATTYGSSTYLFNIGGGGIFNTAGDYFLGSVDEVALFDKALTAQQVMDTFAAATPPPWITTQPAAPARDIFVGNIVTLSVVAAGPPPLSYQWRKGTTELSGKTSANLVFNGITEADSGTYDVIVRNDNGSVTSVSVTLSVKPAETTPPTLLYATGNGLFNGVRVWFSEPLDLVSAQTASNYQLSDGVTVTSATLSAPAGYPGDNVVDLATSVQTPGHVYTLTVSGVKDQVQPANTIAAGSTIQFSSWVLSPGFLEFEVWNGLSTTDNSLANTLLKDPRFPNSPDFVSYTTSFSTRPVYPDDSHEGYGGKMSGLLLPTETADYRFFISSDDSSRLYLSNTADPQAKTLIAEETDCCDAFQEPGTPNDDGVTYPTSEPVHLVAGQRYYVEAIWKEGGGGDYCLVAWRKETDPTAAAELPVIPGQYLGIVVDPNADMTFATQPTDQLGVPATTAIEIVSQDFNTSDGGFTVTNTTPPPPGPWVYDGTAGQWVAEGGESACTGPYNSQLNSPSFTVTQDGVVALTFNHRYSFESGLWDAGQVRISVNGGPFTLVPAENFTTNGYAVGNIVGTGIANGQRAFNGDSPGYDTGAFITSKAVLGAFHTNDKLVVEFVGAWDDCSTQQVPGWVIDSMKLDLLVGAQASTFVAEATALLQGQPVTVMYQWQRNDGAGWVDIPGATGASFTIYPTEVDMRATFRVMVSQLAVPGKVIYSNVVKLVTVIPPPTLSIAKSGPGISITYTGTLQSCDTVNGTYQNVNGAPNPYVVADPTGTVFYRSAK
jgi:hypothetical protein